MILISWSGHQSAVRTSIINACREQAYSLRSGVEMGVLRWIEGLNFQEGIETIALNSDVVGFTMQKSIAQHSGCAWGVQKWRVADIMLR